jgi:zinc transport system ATP-binding protein
MHCHDEVVALENVSFSYGRNKVIENLSFTVLQRDFIGLIGSNGAGKTTLLKMIVGLKKPDQGHIRLFGVPISQFKDWDLIGYVPQARQWNPLFPATVKEIVLSGLYGKKKLFKRVNRSDLQKCMDALAALGIEDLADRMIGQLSGGQQQRVFLARALINNPKLLILDEPMVGVDVETQENFFRLIRHMHQRHDITFLMVSHDVDMMLSYLGDEPTYISGKLKFYVKHSHALPNCEETDLTHSLRQYHQQEKQHEPEKQLQPH